MASLKEDTSKIVAQRCWFVKLIDKDHQKFDLKISCPIGFLFDVIFMVLVDKSDFSSTNIFMNTRQEELTISLNNSSIQKNSFFVCVYGLKTIISSTEQYDRAVCYGNKEIECPVDIQVPVLLEQYDEVLHTLPLSSKETQGTLPVTIHRHPPSLYRLDVNLMFTSEKDFIVFVRAKTQLRCFIVSGWFFNNNFPFELPSASSVECKVLCTCREKRVDGSVWITTTESHSPVISFKTCTKYCIVLMNNKFSRCWIHTDCIILL